MLRGFGALPAGKKIAAMVALAALIAFAAGAAMWARQPEYRVLFTNVSDRDGGLIIAALTQMNIPYRFTDNGGAIQVPSNRVHEARLQLASKGLPKGSIVGFELLENQKLGATQFQEHVNYQRALEGELARSIQSLSAVQSARVHLAMPKQSVFLRDQQKPTASVLVNLYPGRSLDRAQVSGIAHLIAASVPDLPTESVSVLDQNGGLLSGNTAAANGLQLDPGQLAYVQQTEQSYIQRIVDILEPVVGRDNVRAQVSADLDFSQSESTAETYKPNGKPAETTIRSQQSSESANSTNSGAQGVPGALSNQPPGPTSAPINGAAKTPATGAGGAGSTRRDSTVNYEVDKTVKHVRSPVGAVKRLSAAVVVNHRKGKDKSGQSSYAPLTEQQLEQIRTLVKEAIGLDDKRGDSLNVVNTAFAAEDVPPIAEIALWKRPETLSYARDIGKSVLVGALALYLLFGVVRPFFRQLAAQQRVEPALQLASPQAAIEGDASVVRIDPLTKMRELARQDPKLVANVVKNWVSANER
jgi:flagellar M-ring protein FliF